jgi:putative modified peptide
MDGTPFTPELADKLLDKLGSDDAFRELFRHDTEAAMLQLGAPADFKIGACLRPKPLASKEIFRRSRAIMRDVLLSKDGHQPHCLEGK